MGNYNCRDLLTLSLKMSKSRNINEIKEFIQDIQSLEVPPSEIIENINLILTGYCQFNYIEGVKFLLLESKINCTDLVSFYNDQCFRVATKYGNLDIVEFLLTNPKLAYHPNIHSNNDEALSNACINNDLKMVEYLCLSPQLEEKANIYADNGYPLKMACYNKNETIVNFFINNLNMQIDYLLGREIDIDNDFNMNGKLYEIIDKRDNINILHNNLTKTLIEPNNVEHMKLKVKI